MKVTHINIFDVDKKNFRQLPPKSETENGFDSVLIIPTGELHGSGWGAFAAVGCKGNDAVCFWSEGSDVLEIDGIGGYGDRIPSGRFSLPKSIPVKGWKIDFTPKGIMRIFPNRGYKLILPDIPVSSFELYAEERNEQH